MRLVETLGYLYYTESGGPIPFTLRVAGRWKAIEKPLMKKNMKPEELLSMRTALVLSN